MVSKIGKLQNTSAGQILGIPLASLQGAYIGEVADKFPVFRQFRAGIEPHLLQTQKDWREQITISGNGNLSILMCSGTTLSGTHHMQHGHIIVIDDITALVQGQRNAAWSEMARRLAHEIKNPLTPIQLATERLRHKYLRGMHENDTDTFERLTNTIIQQVETMKGMVNSFSDFSMTTLMNLQPTDINEVLNEVVDLYANLNGNAEIITSLSDNLPLLLLDKDKIRQVLNNLLKNAFDACDTCEKFRLEISSDYIHEDVQKYIEIRIKDSGQGITEDIMVKMFDPYTTTKTRGTGLGLAIVKKIIEEHKGQVMLVNNKPGPGACAVIRLPVTGQSGQVNMENSVNREAV